jgi:hypothetical protein
MVEKEETSWSPMQPFLPCMSDIAPCRIGLCFMTLLVLCSNTRCSWSINLIECSEWKRTFLNSNVKDDNPNWGKNFQSESIIDVIDILLDDRSGWIHEDVGEIILTCHRK